MIKVSVITICYNNEQDIRPTLDSVVHQTYPNIEYIVVDGASEDNSLSIIKEYKDRISLIISEPDKGIYDAINKGIRNATGDVVGLIHAGDKLYDNEVINKIATEYESDPVVDATYGNSKTLNLNGKIVGVNYSPSFNLWRIRWGWMAPHQSIYMRRELFDYYGFYRTDLGGAADYELFIRFFYLHGKEIKVKQMKEFIIWFSNGGVSTKAYKSKLKVNGNHSQVIRRSWIENGLKPLSFLPIIRPFWLLRVYLAALMTREKSNR